jgi:hypothetical protein
VSSAARTWTVYTVIDPAGKPLYVGQTVRFDDKRKRSHAKRVNKVVQRGDVLHPRRALYIELARRFDRLVTPDDITQVVESGISSAGDALAAEKRLILQLAAAGETLYNKTHNRRPELHDVPGLANELVPVELPALTELDRLTVQQLDACIVQKVDLAVPPAPELFKLAGRARPAVITYGGVSYLLRLTKTELLALVA